MTWRTARLEDGVVVLRAWEPGDSAVDPYANFKDGTTRALRFVRERRAVDLAPERNT